MSQPKVQRTLVEVQNAPAEVVSGWLHDGQLEELLRGDDPGAPEPPVGADTPPAPAGSADQGVRGQVPAGQIRDVSELQRMTPEQIVAARRAGRLRSLGYGSSK